MIKKILSFALVFCSITLSIHAQERPSKTVGASFYGSFQLFDTTPSLDFGLGGGVFFDYRMNERFSFTLESFFSSHNASGRSNAENRVSLIALPTATFKFYFLNNTESRFDPYVGLGVGLYYLTEGDVANETGGLGLGAQIELGSNFYLSDRWSLGAAATFRSIAIINDLSGPVSASAHVPLSLQARVGYHF